jgi:hypothetical protein
MNKSILGLLLLMGLSGCGGYQPQPLFGREPLPEEFVPQEAPAEDGTTPSNGNGENPPPKPVDPMEAAYQEIRKSIFEPKCFSCHKPGMTRGGVDLTSLSKIKSKPGLVVWGNPGESSLFMQVYDSAMPPGDPLDEATVQILQTWVESSGLSVTPVPAGE